MPVGLDRANGRYRPLHLECWMRHRALLIFGWLAVVCDPSAAQTIAQPDSTRQPADQRTSADQTSAQPASIRFPGSGWWLTPPPGFALSNTPTVAFRHPNGTSLTLIEFNRLTMTRANFGEIGAVTAAGTADEGRLESVEAVMVGGRPAFIVTARMPNRKARAFNFFMEGNRNNVGATLTVPDAVTDLGPAAIRAALLSVTDIPPSAGQPVDTRPIQFPGTSWSIAPPSGFALSTSSPTLIEHRNGAVIMLIESPAGRIDVQEFGRVGTILKAGTTDETRVEALEPLTVGGRPALLLRLRMTKRALVNHTVVVEGDGSNVNASVLVPDAATYPDAKAIRAALMSVVETKRSAEQRLAELPFRFGELSGMRVVNVVANNVVILTDGPGDRMDEATDQPFAMVSVFPMGPRDRFNPARDVTTAAAEISRQYPGATILTQIVEQTANGPVATVTYRRVPPGRSETVAGTLWARAVGGYVLFFVAQHPPNRPELKGRLARIRDGVTLK
jgi:hypothetical protein